MLGIYRLLPVFSILATGPITGLAAPHTQRWGRMKVKHSWNAVPQYWESLGHPSADSSIDLYLALKPQHENAIIDTLLEVSDPRHERYVGHRPIHARTTHLCHLPVADTALIYPGSRQLSSLLLTLTHSTLSIPGSRTTESLLPLSQ